MELNIMIAHLSNFVLLWLLMTWRKWDWILTHIISSFSPTYVLFPCHCPSAFSLPQLPSIFLWNRKIIRSGHTITIFFLPNHNESEQPTSKMTHTKSAHFPTPIGFRDYCLNFKQPMIAIWASFHKGLRLIASFLDTRFAIELRLISVVRLILTHCETEPWYSWRSKFGIDPSCSPKICITHRADRSDSRRWHIAWCWACSKPTCATTNHNDSTEFVHCRFIFTCVPCSPSQFVGTI